MAANLEYVAPRYLSAAETAKLVRQALKKPFPGVKFSVRSKTYSGGASIDVSWVDGPTTKQVDSIIGVYSGADFDGMIDMKCYSQSWIEQDGTVHVAHDSGTEGSRGYLPERIEDPRTPGAELVRFGADFVFPHREISPEWTAAIFELFTNITGVPLDPADKWNVWNTRVPLAIESRSGRLLHMRPEDGDQLSTIFHQFTGARQGGDLTENPCTHPEGRSYSWESGPTLYVSCGDCGAILSSVSVKADC